MEARRFPAALCAAFVCYVFSAPCEAGSARSTNFVVRAPTQAFAAQVCREAESLRLRLAREWLGRELPPWQDPVPIEVFFRSGAGGVTSFEFHNRVPRRWTMEIQGSKERILDSVLPHEITHTIFATHYGQQLPRWCDEGACTTVEHISERRKQDRILVYFLTHDKGIPFNQMFRMMEYPREMLSIYAQGYSVCRFLIAQGGKQKFVKFIKTGLDTRDWDGAVRKHYGFKNLSELQLTWNDWVAQGSPRLPDGVQLVDADGANSRPINSRSGRTGETVPVTIPSSSAPFTPAEPQQLPARNNLENTESIQNIPDQAPLQGRLLAISDAEQLAAQSATNLALNGPGNHEPVRLAVSSPVPQPVSSGQVGWYARMRDQASSASRSSARAERSNRVRSVVASPGYRPGSIGRILR